MEVPKINPEYCIRVQGKNDENIIIDQYTTLYVFRSLLYLYNDEKFLTKDQLEISTENEHKLTIQQTYQDRCILIKLKNLRELIPRDRNPKFPLTLQHEKPFQVVKDKKNIRVLCLGGGGIRGIAQLEILKWLEKGFGNLKNVFDVIVGSSIGGILAWFIACTDLSINEMQQILIENGNYIFGEASTLQQFFGSPRFNSDRLQQFIMSYLGQQSKKISEIEIPFGVTKVINDKLQLNVSKQPGNFDKEKTGIIYDENLLIKDALMQTSAAPTYFKTHKNGSDGGLGANCPSLLGYLYALSLYQQQQMQKQIQVVFVGTGYCETMMPVMEGKIKQILNVEPFIVNILNIQQNLTHQMMYALETLQNPKDQKEGNRLQYYKIDFKMDDIIDLADTRKFSLEVLKHYGEQIFLYCEDSKKLFYDNGIPIQQTGNPYITWVELLKNFQQKEKRNKIYILIGGSQVGKSNFIRYLDNTERTFHCRIGNGRDSKTKYLSIYQIKNKNIFNDENSNIFFLDTIGFGETSGNIDDVKILADINQVNNYFFIYYQCTQFILESLWLSELKVEGFLFFQPINSPDNVTGIIKTMVNILGQEIVKSSCIILTKSNMKDDQSLNQTLEEILVKLQNIKTSFQIQGEVIDFFTPFHNRLYGIKSTQEQQLIEQKKKLLECLKSFNGVDLTHIFELIKNEIKNNKDDKLKLELQLQCKPSSNLMYYIKKFTGINYYQQTQKQKEIQEIYTKHSQALINAATVLAIKNIGQQNLLRDSIKPKM